MPATVVERRFALTRVRAGDYLLLSNDGRHVFRICRYVDGPSGGLPWPRDREMWAARRWVRSPRGATLLVDLENWDAWEVLSDMHATRRDAVQAALGWSA